MALIPLIEPGTGDEAQNRFLAQTLPLNLFKSLAHAPGLAELTSRYGREVLYKTALDGAARELAIIRAAHLADCAYELGHHERIGRDAGLTRTEIDVARGLSSPEGLSPLHRLALDFANEITVSHRASAALVNRALNLIGAPQTVELTLTVGYYLMVAYFLKTFEIPFEGADFKDGVDIRVRPEDRARPTAG